MKTLHSCLPFAALALFLAFASSPDGEGLPHLPHHQQRDCSTAMGRSSIAQHVLGRDRTPTQPRANIRSGSLN